MLHRLPSLACKLRALHAEDERCGTPTRIELALLDFAEFNSPLTLAEKENKDNYQGQLRKAVS
jgi:hypothetical protein